MDVVDIQDVLLGYVQSNWSATQVAWPNRNFTPPEKAYWIRPVVKMGTSFIGEIGEVGIGYRVGVFMISVFGPPNDGRRTGATHCKTLEALFRRKTISGVMLDEPASDEIGNDGNGYYHWLMSVPFTTWVGENVVEGD